MAGTRGGGRRGRGRERSTGSGLDDRALVRAIQAGESERFEELYARYHARVFGFALRRVGAPADAEDVTQEVFLQIHRSIASYQGRASLATWIFGIAHHVVCRHYRSKGSENVPLERAASCEPRTEASLTERTIDAARAVERCTDALVRARPPEHLEIFRLFYGMGRPLRVIAGVTGRPTNSVKDSLRRSRNLLLRSVPDIRTALAASA